MFLSLEKRLREAVAAHIRQNLVRRHPDRGRVAQAGAVRRAGAAGELCAGKNAQAAAAQDRRTDRGFDAAGGRRRLDGDRRRGLHQRALRPRRLCRGPAPTQAARRGCRRKNHRRAHQHQPQQGGPHRPPAQLRARRHPGAHGARIGQERGGAELHRQHRRAGRRRRRRLPLPREEVRSRRAGPGRRSEHALRFPVLGPLRAHFADLQRRAALDAVACRDAEGNRGG